MKSLLLILLLLSAPAWARSTQAFNSNFEGIYQIDVRCDSNSSTCNPKLFTTLDRVTIIDTHLSFGVWVSFSNSVQGDVTETFLSSDVGPSGNQVSGYPKIGNGFGRNSFNFSYFNAEVDPATGDIKGSMVFTDDGSTYLYHGKKLFVVGDITHTAPATPLKPEEILGTYHGQFGKHSGKLVVTQLPDGNLFASYSSDDKFHDASGVQFTYSMNTWDPVYGCLRLVFLNSRFFTLGELAANVFKNSAGEIELVGFQFTGFAGYPVHMKRVLARNQLLANPF